MRYPMPRPVIDKEVPASLPEESQPWRQPQLVCNEKRAGQWWRSVMRKITYGMASDGRLYRVEEQAPVHTAYALHDPLPDWLGRGEAGKGSMKTVPEGRVFQSGTDVVVRGHAASAQPVREMAAGVVVGKHMHKLRVFGERISRVENGRVVFSEPQLFEWAPLRYELAFGGSDQGALARTLERLSEKLGADEFRKSSAFFKDHLPFVVPIAYARNPYGMGYVADALEPDLHNVPLPRIELANDLLTPERFAAGAPMQWLNRPVPAGMDFMDAGLFPRSAMLGLPPLGYSAGQDAGVVECEWGQVPEQFCKGNIVRAEIDEVEQIRHPEHARCAPIGLRLPLLSGTEPISLVGMQAERQRLDLHLPGERPVFYVPGPGTLMSSLWQIFIDADAARVELLWGAAWQSDRELGQFEDREVLKTIQIRGERLS